MYESAAIWAGAIGIITLFTYIAFLEKAAVARHHYAHFVLSRTVYMLLLAVAIIFILDPKVLSSRVMFESLRDPIVLCVGALTSIAVCLYYWLLTKGDLYVISMVWPAIMIFTVISSAFVLKEKINCLQWIGVIIAFAGISMVVLCKN